MVRKYDPKYTGRPMIHPNYGKASVYTGAELKNLRAHYCAEAQMVDRWVGRVLQKIDDLGLWQNSIVVFTSDHGMSLGEHNRTGRLAVDLGDRQRRTGWDHPWDDRVVGVDCWSRIGAASRSAGTRPGGS